jgi:hypothetical protein
LNHVTAPLGIVWRHRNATPTGVVRPSASSSARSGSAWDSRSGTDSDDGAAWRRHPARGPGPRTGHQRRPERSARLPRRAAALTLGMTARHDGPDAARHRAYSRRHRTDHSPGGGRSLGSRQAAPQGGDSVAPG